MIASSRGAVFVFIGTAATKSIITTSPRRAYERTRRPAGESRCVPEAPPSFRHGSQSDVPVLTEIIAEPAATPPHSPPGTAAPRSSTGSELLELEQRLKPSILD